MTYKLKIKKKEVIVQIVKYRNLVLVHIAALAHQVAYDVIIIYCLFSKKRLIIIFVKRF